MPAVPRGVYRVGLAILALVGALYLIGILLPRAPACEISQTAEAHSPSGKMVAHNVLLRCSPDNGSEVQVWIGEPKTGLSGQVVFAAPPEYIDKTSGRAERTRLKLVWHSEDFLEILYSPQVLPRQHGYEFNRNGLKVRADSKYQR